MTTLNPLDVNNDFFKFSNLQNSGLDTSTFSLQYKPSTLSAFAANPETPVAGATSPTTNTLANNTSNQQNQPNVTQSNPTALSPVYQFKPITTPSGSGASSSGGGLGSTALSLGSSILKSTTNVGAGVTSAINDFGASIGFGSGGLAAIPSGLGAADTAFLTSAQAASGAVAEGTAGALGTTASLSGVLGAAGLGFMGGGMLAGFLGENQTGGSIGGGLGAGIGFAVGGPVGALIGGIGGSLFGGMFGGNSTPTQASNFRAYTGAGTDFASVGYAEKNAQGYSGFNKQVAGQIQSALQSATAYLGTSFPDMNIMGGISTEHGGASITINNDPRGINDTYSFDPKDPNSLKTAIGQAITSLATHSGYTDTEKLNQFIKQYSSGGTGSTSGLGMPGPSIPNNPHGTGEQTSWQQFLDNYKAQQNANAAPTPTS